MIPANKDQILILASAFSRALAIGLIAVIFSLYLAEGGLGVVQIGFLIGTGLAGRAAGTFLVSFWADQIGRRRTLLLLSGLTALGGFGFALYPGFTGLLLVAFFGMMNAMGRERGALFSLEQAILPQTTTPQNRTQIMAWYNLVLDVGMALGSLLGWIPALLRHQAGLSPFSSYQWMFVLCGGLGVLATLLYLGLTPSVEIHGATPWHKVAPKTRRILTKLCLLFGFDSLAGGFLPASLIAFWFFKRFGVGEEMIAPLFFIGHLLSAVSYLVAAWLSRRIGLVKTMVFTHIPANLFIVAIPFMPSLPLAMGLYLVREFLVEMDVPTRQSYVMGLVEPKERTLASGVVSLTRSLAWVVAPGLAGFVMKTFSIGLPLILGGGLKVIYDLMLYRSFRHIKPPEEQ